ncbi:MAG: hydroxyacid dehydrogenase [Bacteriovorax sp.]|nr:hydroxyacid dehydrogenase [Bacteriovorax sp.]
MNPFIVVPDGFDKSLFEELKKITTLNVHPTSKVDQVELKALLPKVEGLIIRSATTINKELLDLAPNLKIVIRAGEGTDNIDKALCAEKGIKVANTPGANNNSAAEQAVALMMTVLRNTALADATMKAGKWEKNSLTGLELWKKKVGIVGFGRIGQIVAKRISGFEPEILFFDPVLMSSDMPNTKKVNDLKEIFSTCDIITLHTPLMPQTKGMITGELLNLMKKDAILVNASRGGIVDEDALYNVLKEKKIRGAGFDVFAVEPLPADSKLLELTNLVMSPHVGASTEEAQFRVGEMAVHQINEFFKNNNLLNEVKAK